MPCKDPEKARAYDRAWRLANREKIVAQTRAYHASHRDQERQYGLAYRATNRDVVNERQNLRSYERRPQVLAKIQAIRIAFLLMREESKLILAPRLAFATSAQDHLTYLAAKTPSVDYVLADYIPMKDGGALQEI